jgi:peptidoglycan/LPS O-acetylase OafA/YrhL
VLGFSVAPNGGLIAAVANLLCLQTIAAPCYGSNGPLWSIAYEWWYYWLFPLVLIVLVKGRLGRRALGGLGLVALCALAYPFILAYFPIWLLGVAVRAYWPKLAIKSPWGWLAFLVSLGGGLLIGRGSIAGGYSEVLSDYLLSIGTVLLISQLVYNPPSFNRPSIAIGRTLSNISFSLYTIHFPILVLIVALLRYKYELALPLQPNLLTPWAVFFVICLFLLFLAWLFSMLIEQRYHAVRKYLLRATNRI